MKRGDNKEASDQTHLTDTKSSNFTKNTNSEKSTKDGGDSEKIKIMEERSSNDQQSEGPCFCSDRIQSVNDTTSQVMTTTEMKLENITTSEKNTELRSGNDPEIDGFKKTISNNGNEFLLDGHMSYQTPKEEVVYKNVAVISNSSGIIGNREEIKLYTQKFIEVEKVRLSISYINRIHGLGLKDRIFLSKLIPGSILLIETVFFNMIDEELSIFSQGTHENKVANESLMYFYMIGLKFDGRIIELFNENPNGEEDIIKKMKEIMSTVDESYKTKTIEDIEKTLDVKKEMIDIQYRLVRYLIDDVNNILLSKFKIKDNNIFIKACRNIRGNVVKSDEKFKVFNMDKLKEVFFENAKKELKKNSSTKKLMKFEFTSESKVEITSSDQLTLFVVNRINGGTIWVDIVRGSDYQKRFLVGWNEKLDFPTIIKDDCIRIYGFYNNQLLYSSSSKSIIILNLEELSLIKANEMREGQHKLYESLQTTRYLFPEGTKESEKQSDLIETITHGDERILITLKTDLNTMYVFNLNYIDQHKEPQEDIHGINETLQDYINENGEPRDNGIDNTYITKIKINLETNTVFYALFMENKEDILLMYHEKQKKVIWIGVFSLYRKEITNSNAKWQVDISKCSEFFKKSLDLNLKMNNQYLSRDVFLHEDLIIISSKDCFHFDKYCLTVISNKEFISEQVIIISEGMVCFNVMMTTQTIHIIIPLFEKKSIHNDRELNDISTTQPIERNLPKSNILELILSVNSDPEFTKKLMEDEDCKGVDNSNSGILIFGITELSRKHFVYQGVVKFFIFALNVFTEAETLIFPIKQYGYLLSANYLGNRTIEMVFEKEIVVYQWNFNSF